MRLILQITTMLIVTALLLTAYSFTSYEIEIGDLKIKKTKIKEFLLDIPENREGKRIAKGYYADLKQLKQEPMDTTTQKILLIGDSMLEGLGPRLKDYTAQNNHQLNTVIWYSSSTEYFGQSDTLKYFIKKFQPTYIMLVIGANELFVSDIIRTRQGYVKKILNQIDTINYVWIGPPNWKDDTGINDLIIKNVGKGRYFPSKNLNYKRSKDGAHPTHESAAVWMDSIATWVMRDSYRPIKLEKPLKKNPKSGNVTILQPLK
jgi:hypothetical protein